MPLLLPRQHPPKHLLPNYHDLNFVMKDIKSALCATHSLIYCNPSNHNGAHSCIAQLWQKINAYQGGTLVL